MATRNKGQRPTDRAQPGASSTRLEKSRKLAQKRRETYKDLMTGIMESLPFSREVLSQLDYNSRLRLGLCFLKMKKLLDKTDGEGPKMIEAPPTTTTTANTKTALFQPGVLQELMIEAMDGFLMVLLLDGSIVYVSESIQKHMGLFQSEHMGTSLYDLVLEEDHASVKMALSSAEIKAHTKFGVKRVSVPCSFFCRMRCSRNKVANTQSKSPGYKVVHTSGYFQLRGSEAFLVSLVKPVTPPNILEIRMEGNMFVTHYALDMRCTFFDGRLRHLMGYAKEDLKGKLAFDFHHHDDTEATLECSRGIQARGEGMSGYYRMINKNGQFVWLQTRATMMFDSHTGNPSYIVCMNFVISKEKGQESLMKKALPSPEEVKSDVFISEEKSKAHDPFPIPREDGMPINPLSDDLGAEDDPSHNISLSSSSVAMLTTKKNDDVIQIKTEINSPPDVPTEEPTSTTSPPQSSLTNSSRSSPTDISSWEADSGHNHGNCTPSSGIASVGDSGGECVPDSTSAEEGSPNTVPLSGGRNGIESGYSSRVESTSSSYRRKQNSDSDSSNPGSTSGMFSGTQIRSSSSQNEVFPEHSSDYNTVPNSNTGSCSSISESDVVILSGGGVDSGAPVSQPACQYQQQHAQLQHHTTQDCQLVEGITNLQRQPQAFGASQQHQQQTQRPMMYQSRPPQQPQSVMYESGHQLKHNGQQQQAAFQSSQQQPITYKSTLPPQPQQPIAYQSNQQQTTPYQSGPMQQQSFQNQQQISYQGRMQHQGSPLEQHNVAYQSQLLSHLTTQAQQQMKQEITQPPPPCRYSMQHTEVNGLGTQQYQYQNTGFQPSPNTLQQTPSSHNFQTPFQNHTTQVAPTTQSPQIPINQNCTPQMPLSQSHTHQAQVAPHGTNVYQPEFQQLPGTQHYHSVNHQPHGNPPSSGLDPGNLPLFSSLGQSSGATPTFNPSATAEAAHSARLVNQGYQTPVNSRAATVSVDGMAITGHVMSHVTNHMTPDLVNLTGEDLRILDFIDQYDGNCSAGQFVQQ